MADLDDLLRLLGLLVDFVDRVAREGLVEELEEIVDLFAVQFVLYKTQIKF